MNISSSPIASATEAGPQGKLAGSLGTGSIVFMVVAAAAPLTVIGGVTPLGFLLGNGAGFPSLYLVSAVILVLFSVGLSAMTRQVPRPGAFYTYVDYGLGRAPGMAAAYLALLTYTSIQAAVYGYIGELLRLTLTGMGVPDMPWWLYSLGMVGLVAVLGYRHIDLSAKVLGVLLVAEITIVLVLVGAVALTGGPEGLSLTPFEPSRALSGAPGIGLMLAMAAFIGFESTVVFRDEAKNPNRTIPKATYIAVIGIGSLYALVAWGLVMAWGPGGVVNAAAADPAGMLITTTLNYLGPLGAGIINVLMLTSLFAAALSFHNVLTRYKHAMAGNGVLHRSLATVHNRHRAPSASSLAQSGVAATVVLLFAVSGLDPILQVFTWMAGVSTLAISVLMAFTSAAVIVYFRRNSSDRRMWHTLVAPLLGLVGLGITATLVALNFPLLVGELDATGTPVFGPTSITLVSLTVVALIAGLVQSGLKRRQKDALA
ncbi:APC family permease [Arthrobacter globiformis]|uniref:APC family permease n=1 Tax=Arthrobacter globiformis TaxID=1665 RepID=UPI00279290EA|nr:APC family permease [Arthrobacter globiformis]MDQ0618175.1 amino acid transporter [Arthrobacter globiformis]